MATGNEDFDELCEVLGDRFDKTDGIIVVGYVASKVDERGLVDITPAVIYHYSNDRGAIGRHDGGTLLIRAGGQLQKTEGREH